MSTANEIPFVNLKLPLNDEDKIKEEALLILKKIKPTWDYNFVSFKDFTAGITNKILCVSYAPANGTTHKERLLFRVYGNNTDKIIDRHKEFNNWLYLASHGCAARLYARFSNGIVSGFLPGKPLTVENVRDEAIITNICKALAKMHKLKPDTGDGTKPVLFIKINQYLAHFSGHYQDKHKQQQYDTFFRQQKISFSHDLRTLQEAVQRLQAKVVFCHNDLLVHNIIHNEKTELHESAKKNYVGGLISFIDYEYADYNYQGFDIANHFCEYAGVEDFNYSRCPDEECKRIWVTKYLTCFLEREHVEEDVEALLRSCDTFEAAAHFFWALWALVQSQISAIDFDYLGYAIQRYEYFQKSMFKCASR